MDADAVVVGAGALGLSTGLHCALAGRSVAVVEHRTAGSQASGRAAGLFKSVQADELRTRLARRSIEKAADFADWAGVPLNVARSGSFLIARTGPHRELLRRELAQSRRWGADVREATAAQLADGLSYYRAAGDEYALWCPEDIYIEEPASLVHAYLAACQRCGVVLLEDEPVIGIPVAGGRVAGVETATRSIRAPVVVDAAGGWVRPVAELAGARVPLAPVRHQLLITAPAPQVDPGDPITRVVDAAVYLRPARGGLMFGGFEASPLPIDPRRQPASFSTDDVPLDLGVLGKLAAQLTTEVPAVEVPTVGAGPVAGAGQAADAGQAAGAGPVAGAETVAGTGPVAGAETVAGTGPVAGAETVAEHRGGLFTMSPDGRFVVGPVPGVPGFWVASGCNGSGFSSSPALGEQLAAWIISGVAPPGMMLLAPDRFGPASDDALVKDGLWQYAHYYDPVGSDLVLCSRSRLPGRRQAGLRRRFQRPCPGKLVALALAGTASPGSDKRLHSTPRQRR